MSLKYVVIMERLSLVCALFFFSCWMPFFLFQRCMTKRVCLSPTVFVNSLSIYSVFLKMSLEKLALSSRSLPLPFMMPFLTPNCWVAGREVCILK